MGKASANYGSSATLEGLGAGNRKWSLLAFVDGHESLSWGITCQILDITGADRFDVQFRITWGDGGVAHSIVLTPQNGFTINVHGSSIRVEASIDSAAGDSAEVSASLSEQDSGRLAPYFTIFTGGVAAGGGQEIVELPEFTRRVMVIPVDPAPPAGITWSVDDGTWTMNFEPNEKMDWTPVSGGGITITNNEVVNVTNFTVYCELSI